MSFSQSVITTIKATAPILDQHGETLTRHFYTRMFRNNPEVKPYFNMSHQSAGKQQRALAGAVCAYAHNIDNLGALGDAVELIAQKHCALQIMPEHYPIVGSNLLESIKEVLGEGATEDVVSAWATAYGALADILIAREKAIYDEVAARPNGWRGFRKFTVSDKTVESSIITSFTLTPEDGGLVPEYHPGQYLTIRVATPCGSTTMRNYSLSAPSNGSSFRISVRRDIPTGDAPEGYVSNHLHRNVEVGSVLDIAPPSGVFTLKMEADGTTPRPVIFAAAGVGVTPLYPMLVRALQVAPPTTPIFFIHGVSCEDTHAFRKAVNDLAAAHPNLKVVFKYSNPAEGSTLPPNATRGLINAETLKDLDFGDDTIANADVYMCGPKGFMSDMVENLDNLGVPPTQIHYEFYGPLEDLKKCPFAQAK